MYSPYSDFYKMVFTPNSVVFKVLINGKEFYGRPVARIKVEHLLAPGEKQSCLFQTYSNIQSFEQGSPLETIELESCEVKGIEAIDTKDREPLDQIILACTNIDTVPGNADIHYIQKEIPVIIERLILALTNFEKLHLMEPNDNVQWKLEEAIEVCKGTNYQFSDKQRKNIIIDIKEKVSESITNLMHYSIYSHK